jgi:hypothetical protein
MQQPCAALLLLILLLASLSLADEPSLPCATQDCSLKTDGNSWTFCDSPLYILTWRTPRNSPRHFTSHSLQTIHSKLMKLNPAASNVRLFRAWKEFPVELHQPPIKTTTRKQWVIREELEP